MRVAASGPRLDRIIRRPGPSSKLRPLVVGHSLLDLSTCIHYKWTVLNYGFANWTALEKKKLTFAGSILEHRLRVGLKLDGGAGRNRAAAYTKRTAGKKIKHAVCAALRRRHRPCGFGRHLNGPDRNVRVGTGRP